MACQEENPCGLCSFCKDERVGAAELLDEFWFYQNMFVKTRILRSSLEASCSSSAKEMMPWRSTNKGRCPTSTASKGSHHNYVSIRNSLIRTPSLPPCLGRERPNQEQEISNTLSKSSSKKNDVCVRNNLSRAPSLPPCSGREKPVEEQENSSRSSPAISKCFPSKNDVCVRDSLLRAPSLPPCLGREKPGEEYEISSSSNRATDVCRSEVSIRNNLLRMTTLPLSMAMDKPREEPEISSRQDQKLGRFLSPSDRANSFSPLANSRPSSKSMSKKPSIPKGPLQRDLTVEGTNKDFTIQAFMNGEVPNYNRICRGKSSKSLNDLEFEEVKGFMDLGFTFNKEDMSPSIANIIPGLQEKKASESNKVMRPYLSEAWLQQRPDPQKLDWIDRKSAVDMKEQLKFWARTVASNVRQKC